MFKLLKKWYFWLAILVAGLLLFLPGVLSRRNGQRVQSRLVEAVNPGAGLAAAQGFARATGPSPLHFPEDFGPHPNYQTEWWYYTGNLETGDGRHFGFQLTFFRRALLPLEAQPNRNSVWAATQVYMAHFALTDVKDQHYQAFERISRGAAGLAGAQAVPFQVWLDDWSVAGNGAGRYKLHAAQDSLTIDLELSDVKGPILQGDQGYSQKGPQPGQASYYYSLTHLASEGIIHVNGQSFAVKGPSWMDHEFSTSALAKDQVGWDWFALQLDDGGELMVYQIRQSDGSPDPFSGGTWISADGTTRHLNREDFRIKVEDTWKSPHSGALYPSRWVLKVPGLAIRLDIEPYLADQELNVSYSYWEGAVHFRGERSGQLITGDGYIELTGYARPMGGEF